VLDALVDIVNRADMRMIQRGGGARFTPEPLQRLKVFGQRLWEKLQGDVAAQAGVLGLLDDTHAAAAQLLEHTIM